MKRFSFPLERVLHFRRQAEDLEFSRLEAFAAERLRLEGQARRMLETSRQARTEAAGESTQPAVELQRAYEYAGALARARETALVQAASTEERRRQQMITVLEARRRVRLLELLRSRKLSRHNRLNVREMEALAGDLYLAKLQRENQKNF